MEIINVRINGAITPLNIIDDFYISWQLSFVLQEKVELDIFDDEKNIIFHYLKDTNKNIIQTKLQLKPLTKYIYKLSINNKYNYTHYFYSGLTCGFDSKAKWIKDSISNVNNEEVGSKAVYFEKTFNLDKLDNLAILNIVGLGLYKLYINKKEVKDIILTPPFTNYNFSILYQTYEISKYLKIGENQIIIAIGEGFFNQSSIDTWDFYKASFKDEPKLLLQLNIGDFLLVSDTSFRASFGKVRANAIRLGEVIDFNAPFEFRNVCLAKESKGKLKASFIEPIKEVKSYEPTILYQDDNKLILDFNINMAGYISAEFKGKKNAKIEICYSDRLENNELDNTSNSQYIYNTSFKYQTDTLILSGKKDKYKPSFSYFGFRYVLIKGKAKISNIKAYLVRTSFKKEGNFISSDKILNQLYNMSIQALESNYLSFPSDCPHREKNGWTGDAYLSADSMVLTFNMHEAYKKWLLDIKDAMLDNGQIPCIIPTDSWGYTWGNGPCWDVAMFKITWLMYEKYQDLAMLKLMYPYLLKYLNYLNTKSNNYLVDIGLGDWNYPKKIKFKVCETKLLASCFYYYMVDIVSKIANILGNDNLEYLSLKENIKKSIIANYAFEDTLTGMSALTYFDIINRIDDIIQYLNENNYNYHFGIHGLKLLLDSLVKYNYIEEGYKLLKRVKYPSFINWIKKGQTTLCEDFELTNSLNHHMFSSIVSFMIKGIAGVDIDNNGYLKINKPLLNINIKVDIPSIYGIYKLDISNKKIKVIIPAGGKLTYNNKIYTVGSFIIKNC